MGIAANATDALDALGAIPIKMSSVNQPVALAAAQPTNTGNSPETGLLGSSAKANH
jgi:hypothetical protein